MGTAELFLILCGRAKGILMSTLSRESELERFRIKINQIKIGLRMKTGLGAFTFWSVNGDGKRNNFSGKILSLSVECCLDNASLKKRCKFGLFSSLYVIRYK